MPVAGEGRNWGLLAVLRVSELWILSAISCELQAEFLLFTRMQQHSVKCIAFWLLRLLHWVFRISISLLCAQHFSNVVGPMVTSSPMKHPRPELDLSFSPLCLVQFHW